MPESLYPTGTVTPIEERCTDTVKISGVELRCGIPAEPKHEVHFANLMGRGGVTAVLSWKLEDF